MSSCPDTDWQATAACVGTDPNLWFPGADWDQSVEARLICARCPVSAECLADALGSDSPSVNSGLGIRAGLTLSERRAGVDPEEALVAAKRRAGWRPCVECKDLFRPDRSTAKVCGKPCRKVRNAKQTKARYRAQSAAKREKRLARNRAYQRKYGAADRRRRYWADPDKARAQKRASYERHAEEERARKRADYQANPEKYRAKSRAARQRAKEARSDG